MDYIGLMSVKINCQIPKLRDISDEVRPTECCLTTLETRRLTGDQIEVFKILIDYENIDRHSLFLVKEERRTHMKTQSYNSK